jgi:hypothetical protein
MHRTTFLFVTIGLVAVAACGGSATPAAAPGASAAASAAPVGATAAPALGVLGKPFDAADKADLKKAVEGLQGYELKSVSESGDAALMIVTVLATTESPHGEAYPNGKRYQRMVLTQYKGTAADRLSHHENSMPATAAHGRRGDTLISVELEGRPRAEAEAIWATLFGPR